MSAAHEPLTRGYSLAALACTFLSALTFLCLCQRLIFRWINCTPNPSSYDLHFVSQKGETPIQKGEAPISRLPQQHLLFGLDILYRDFWDLHDHNSSNRALSRHNVYGHTFVSTVLGHSTIHTINPANILTVTTDNFADYEKGDWARTISKYMGKGVLVNDGNEWHASRALLKPMFRRNRAADVRMFEPHVDHLIQYIRSQRGEYVDFRRAAQMIVLDITTEMLTGCSTMSLISTKFIGKDRDNSISTPGPALLDLIDELEPHGNKAIELGPFALPIFALRYRKIMSLITGIQTFFETAISDTQAIMRQHRGSAIGSEQVAKIIEEMLLQGMTPEEIQGELQNIFFAAFDTTAALLANLFDCLTRQPTIVKRLQAELAVVVGDRSIVEADVTRLTYLRATILETLRLHSPVTHHERRARTDTVLPRGGGLDGQSPILIVQGTSVVWSTYALNRQAGIHGMDSADFRPERWLTSGLPQLDSGPMLLQSKEAFIPFGSGPRNCLGQQFATLQTSYIAARLLTAFEHFELRDGDAPFQEAAAVTYFNRRGTWIKFYGDGELEHT
ncbi:hypothetical protein MMC11_006962 [Xylographa trunciseda]|nr:hypothetical protein [Xylographa trunciseda]